MLVQKLLQVAQIGGQTVLYLLIILSMISIGVCIERWWYFKKRKINAPETGRKIVEFLRQGDIGGAQAMLKKLPGVEAQVMIEALGWYPDGQESVEKVLHTGVNEHRDEFESGLLFLGTLGNNSPFVGLFGTVLGIVTAFRELAGAQGSANGMNNVMGGIAEALVATAVGILVALPAVIAYNVFQRKSQTIEENVQIMGSMVVAQMNSHRDGFNTRFPKPNGKHPHVEA